MSASTRQKARTLYMVYCRLNQIGTRSLKLERDCLARYYAVNRHSVHVTQHANPLAIVRRNFIADLVQSGWEKAAEASYDVLKRGPIKIVVGDIPRGRSESTTRRFTVSVY